MSSMHNTSGSRPHQHVQGGGPNTKKAATTFHNPVNTDAAPDEYDHGNPDLLLEAYAKFENAVQKLMPLTAAGIAAPTERHYKYKENSCHVHAMLESFIAILDNTTTDVCTDSSPLSMALRLCYERRKEGVPLSELSHAFRVFFNGTKEKDEASCMYGNGYYGTHGAYHNNMMALYFHPHDLSKDERHDHVTFKTKSEVQCASCGHTVAKSSADNAEVLFTSGMSSMRDALDLKLKRLKRTSGCHCPKCNTNCDIRPIPDIISCPSLLHVRCLDPAESTIIDSRLPIPHSQDYWKLVSVVYHRDEHFWGHHLQKLTPEDLSPQWILVNDIKGQSSSIDHTSHSIQKPFEDTTLTPFIHGVTYVRVPADSDESIPSSNNDTTNEPATTPINNSRCPNNDVHVAVNDRVGQHTSSTEKQHENMDTSLSSNPVDLTGHSLPALTTTGVAIEFRSTEAPSIYQFPDDPSDRSKSNKYEVRIVKKNHEIILPGNTITVPTKVAKTKKKKSGGVIDEAHRRKQVEKPERQNGCFILVQKTYAQSIRQRDTTLVHRRQPSFVSTVSSQKDIH